MQSVRWNFIFLLQNLALSGSQNFGIPVVSDDCLWWLRSVKIKHYLLQKVNRASSHKEGGTEEAEVGGWQQNKEEYDVETEHIVEYKKGPNNAWKAQGRPQQATLFLVSKYFVWKIASQMILLSTADIRDCLHMMLQLELLDTVPYVLIEPQLCSETILW